MGLYLGKQLSRISFLLTQNLGAKANTLAVQTLFYDLLQAVKGAAADKENILGIDLDELLVGMLPPPLGRHVGYGTFQDLQQRLLHSLAGDIPGDRGVFAFAGDLVDLIHIDNTPFRQFDIIVGGLDQPQKDIFHIVAYVARLSERSGVGNGKRHLQHPGQGLGKQGLTAAGGTDEKNIALLQLHIVSATEPNALIVVVYRH